MPARVSTLVVAIGCAGENTALWPAGSWSGYAATGFISSTGILTRLTATTNSWRQVFTEGEIAFNVIFRQVKLELVRQPQKNCCCSRAELTAFMLLRGYLTIRSREYILSVGVEHTALARYLFRLLKAVGTGSPEVSKKQIQRLGLRRYQVQVAGWGKIDALLHTLGLKSSTLPQRLSRDPPWCPARCCRRAFVRGAFRTGGSLNTPTGSATTWRSIAARAMMPTPTELPEGAFDQRFLPCGETTIST